MLGELGEMMDALAGVVYNQPNIDRANQYIMSRGLDPAKLSIPWTATGEETAPFQQFKKYIPLKALTNYLYIPIPDLRDQTNKTLAGFDLRYIGPENPKAIRYHKLKRDATSHLVYGLDTFWKDERDYVIVTEGAIDAESLRQQGYPTIAPLTALQSIRWLSFLVALSDRIYLSYDNNEDGQKAMNKLEGYAKLYPDVQKRLNRLLYMGEDWNAVLNMSIYGPEYIKKTIDMQLMGFQK